jgi:uncharacterized protein YcfJ
MLRTFALGLAASCLFVGVSWNSAQADSCSGHSHPTGTIVGAVGGGLIGSQVVHGAGGVIGGAVLGGLAGNAIDRDIDCHHHHYHHAYYRHRYYRRDYDDNSYHG